MVRLDEVLGYLWLWDSDAREVVRCHQERLYGPAHPDKDVQL